MDETFKTARREDAYLKSAKSSTHSTSYDVKMIVEDLISSAIPKANIQGNNGSYSSRYQILSYNTSTSNWVIIIDTNTIRKNGLHCLKVYHLSKAINFNDYYTSTFRHFSSPEAYDRMCAYSRDLLHNYSTLLSPEGLIVEMLCNEYKN